jgi:predicted nucleotidyltransferase component of viral defense system
MVDSYAVETITQRKHALREVTQEIILCGLSRAGFFEPATFYGGTALRIFYGLNRFSEDLDFSLREPDYSFDLAPYLESAAHECSVWGLHFKAEEKRKTRESAIPSDFLKGNTREYLITMFSDDGIANTVAPGELLRIKLELDTDTAAYATFEKRFRVLPMPYEVGLYDEPSLFAGKLHAVIARAWKNRVKGRDLYDYVFYRGRNTSVNLAHLEAKLRQTRNYLADEPLTIEVVKDMLVDRFNSIDFELAKTDVLRFLRDPRTLGVWSREFFLSTIDGITAI